MSVCPTCGRKHKRSNEANARLWALYNAMSDRVRPDGQQYSPETWHLYCKQRWLGCEDIKLPNGRTMTYPRSTADLDTGEFSLYMEAVEAWAAERGVTLDE